MLCILYPALSLDSGGNCKAASQTFVTLICTEIYYHLQRSYFPFCIPVAVPKVG